MIVQNRSTKVKITIRRNEYYKTFHGNHDWVDVTPPRTEKQIAASNKFVRLGKLHRTKANMYDIVRTFGAHHGIYLDAILGLEQMIKEENA